MTSDELRDVAYRITWRASGVRAGAHKSRQIGGTGQFNDLAPFISSPDPRRIAIRASLSDPFENLLVKRYEQNVSITVYVLIDISASMGCVAKTDKLAIACDIAEALSVCSTRAGDRFGLIAFDSELPSEFQVQATRSRATAAAAIEKLRTKSLSRTGVAGLQQAASLLAGSRKLVVLISDFQWQDHELTGAFAALSQHDCLPIEIHDSGWIEGLPDWGFLSLRDSESGLKRLVAMRPSLKDAWKRKENERRANVGVRAQATGRELFSIQNKIVWDRLASYLMHGSAT